MLAWGNKSSSMDTFCFSDMDGSVLLFWFGHIQHLWATWEWELGVKGLNRFYVTAEHML